MKTVEEKAKECIDNLIDSLSLEVNYSVDELKSFAQQDFEKRVKECLITE